MAKLAAVTRLAPSTHKSSQSRTQQVRTEKDPIQDLKHPSWPSHDQQNASNSDTQDHFIQRNGLEFAGTHLIFDFWGATELDNLELMEAALRKSIKVCGATLLHIHLHHFSPNGGISGVAVLAESHISVHTWPERGYAAFDVFMCGDAQPERAIPVLQKAFKPSRLNVTEHLRGLIGNTH